MFFKLTLVLCLVPLSTSSYVPIRDAPIKVDCDKRPYFTFGDSELKIVCNNISITGDKEYKFNFDHDVVTEIEIKNSNVPRVYKQTFSLNKFDVTKIIINNSGLTKIHQNDFSELSQVEELNFADNQISEVEENAFAKNTQLVRLILKKNKLNSLKNLTSYSQIQFLDLRYNLITAIKEYDFNKNFSIRTITLSNNQISEIEENAFLGVTNIYEIDLSYNFIHKLPSSFESIKIKALYMSHNKLKEINCNNVITHLDVSHNYIDEICNLADSLLFLVYSFNDIQLIPEDSFNRSTKLEYLDLSNNEIIWINSHSFRDLKQLSHLNLSFNSLDNIDVLQNMAELKDLDLSHNNLNNILYGTFSGVNSLNILDVSYNDLTSLDSLLTLHDLEVLNILGNPLENIQPQIIVSHLTNLQKIALNLDELACEKLATYLIVFSAHNVEVEIGSARYNTNIHGHHCNPDKDYDFIDPITQNYKKMVYLTDYISQFSAIVLVMLFGLVLLIISKSFDIYKIAKESRKCDKIDQIDEQSSAKLLSDVDTNNDA